MREWVDNPSAKTSDFDEGLKKDEKEWAEIRKPYLLY